jgi:hypothetical protein
VSWLVVELANSTAPCTGLFESVPQDVVPLRRRVASLCRRRLTWTW